MSPAHRPSHLPAMEEKLLTELLQNERPIEKWKLEAREGDCNVRCVVLVLSSLTSWVAIMSSIVLCSAVFM